MSQRMIYQTDATRAKILLEAERCFSEQGFFKAQMKDIAQAVGMSRNTLYRYYRDKFELGFAILDKALQHKFRNVEGDIATLLARDDINVREALESLVVSTHLDESNELDNRFIAEFDAYYSGDRIPDDFRERLSASGLSSFTALDELVKRGQQQGSIRSDIDAHILSATVMNAVQAFHQRMILRNNALIELEIGLPAQLTPVLIKLLMAGLKPDADS